jgi:DNA segregation ATPase FtsK/SpoIIIE-like protein
MKYEHKAIIDAATREGKLPMEKARELMGHDLLKAMVTTISGHAVAFKNMSEQQQDSAIQEMTKDLEAAIDTAILMISSQATKTVRMKLKKVAIGKKWQIVGEAEGDEEYLHELADKTQDQSDVLVLLYERDYLQGLDAIRGEKDQKSLPLDAGSEPKKLAKATAKKTAKAEQKDIILDQAIIDRGRSFVAEFKNASIAGLQSQLKIGYEKADAILKVLAGEGLVAWAGTEESGQYELVRNKDADAKALPVYDDATLEVFYATAVKAVIKATSADDSVLRPIYGDDDNLIEQALMRMEDDGIVSPSSPEGLRDVLTLP